VTFLVRVKEALEDPRRLLMDLTGVWLAGFLATLVLYFLAL
jgi:hypothetical protein